MSDNKYNFNFSENEFKLFSGQQNEVVQLYGVQCFYLPKTLQKFDIIFGEDPLSKFEKAFDLTMYLANYAAFNGQGDMFAKFGMTVTDQISLVIQREDFLGKTNQHNPLEEDLIFFPLSKGIFEIYHVEREDPFYTMGQKSSYRFECRLFEYSNEKMHTGISKVDKLETMGSDSEIPENDEFDAKMNEILDTSLKNPFGDL